MSDEIRTLPDISEMSYKAVLNQIKDVGDEIRRIAAKTELHVEDETYLDELKAHFEELNKKRKEQEREALVARVDAVTNKPLTVSSGDNTPKRTDLDDDPFGEPDSVRDAPPIHNPWDLGEIRTWNRSPGQVANEYRARALSAIEKASGANAKRRETMTKFVEEWDNSRGDLARQMLLTSSPAYVRAFVKAAMGHQSSFSREEQQAVERAMSLTDSAGGYLVPFQLDPTVIITSDGTFSEIRRISRTVVATGDVWNGVSSGAVSFSWDAEGAEVSDDATTFAQPTVPIYKGQAFVPISREALMDEANVAQEVGRLLAFGKDTLEAVAFATGAGSTEPTGIITALAGSSAEISSVTNDVLGLVDIYALDNALPARYRQRATWAANRAIYNRVRQFDTSGGAALWERLGADVPALLLGRPAVESEAMDGALGTGNDYVLVFGDFDNYVIADRIGTVVDFIPHLFHTTTNLPSNKSGWLAYFRVGADSVNDGAFNLLEV
jgi:HK97 family phage major capsid protein